MLRALKVLCLLLLSLAIAAPAEAVLGATDRTAAASLLVPFFETGIDSAVNPHDTLLVVSSVNFAGFLVHYHVWDIDGNPTDLQGNISLGGVSSWSAAMRDLLNTSTPSVRSQLTEGAFYRGFVTIDVVSAPTALNPREAGYPFAADNQIEGFIYYTRLSQGSANGLAMVALESVPPSTDGFLSGFYTGGDNREEIDSTARHCAQQLTTGVACTTVGDDSDINRIHLRIFRSTPLNGSSRAVVFTWIGARTGGPSPYCDIPANGCAAAYTFRQYNEAGATIQDATIRLNHVVNLIPDTSLLGSEAGFISIFDVPNVNVDTQFYGFSFNSANPVAESEPDLGRDFRGLHSALRPRPAGLARKPAPGLLPTSTGVAARPFPA